MSLVLLLNNLGLGSAPAPPPVVVSTIYPGQIDHVADGLARLPQQWKNKPNVLALVTIFLQRYNDLEAVFQALLWQRTITNAVGAQLDTIGKIVGQPRNGLDDATYRRYIYARVTTNRSSGVIEDLITVAKLVLNDSTVTIAMHEMAIESIEAVITGNVVSDAIATILIGFPRSARAAADKLVLKTQPALDAATDFISTTAFTTGALLAGATVLAVDTTIGFATSGTLTLDVGAGAVETVTYQNTSPMAFLNCTPIVNPHSAGARIDATAQPGAGLGDSTEVGQPVVIAYGDAGTTGGRMSDARE